jgi:hypothetical protein
MARHSLNAPRASGLSSRNEACGENRDGDFENPWMPPARHDESFMPSEARLRWEHEFEGILTISIILGTHFSFAVILSSLSLQGKWQRGP